MTIMTRSQIDERCVALGLNIKAVGLVLGDLDNIPKTPEMRLILCLPAHHQKPIWYPAIALTLGCEL